MDKVSNFNQNLVVRDREDFAATVKYPTPGSSVRGPSQMRSQLRHDRSVSKMGSDTETLVDQQETAEVTSPFAIHMNSLAKHVNHIPNYKITYRPIVDSRQLASPRNLNQQPAQLNIRQI